MILKAPANYLLHSIVFSAWKKSLDLVACLFSVKAIPFATIDGSISLPERRKVLLDFKSKPDTKVLLMTLGTGAVGHVPPSPFDIFSMPQLLQPVGG
jgi:hypothetical protein